MGFARRPCAGTDLSLEELLLLLFLLLLLCYIAFELIIIIIIIIFCAPLAFGERRRARRGVRQVQNVRVA